jgi:uncharacterized protein YdaU (DUF1376 family)
MSAPPYMKLFWGDYHKRTRHLKRDQHGAYFLLIGEAWQLGGALPDDDAKLAAWALCTPEEWAAIKPVVMEFFALRRGKWWHDRVREELATYEATSRKRKAAGKKGGKASGGTAKENPEANAYLLPTKPEPEPEPKKEIDFVAEATPKPKPKARSYSEAFEAAWQAYPHHKGRSSKPNAAAVFAKLPDDERDGMVAAIGRFAPNVAETCGGKGAPDMAVWLKDGKHLNWTADAPSTAPARQTFNAPAVRASIVKAQDEDFARRWIDHYCRWEPDGRRLIARTSSVASRLQRDLAEWASANRVTIDVATANDEAAPLPRPKDQAA